VAANLEAIEPSAADSEIGRDALLELLRHVFRPISHEDFEDQGRVASPRGRNAGYKRRTHLVVSAISLIRSARHVLHDRKRRHDHLDAALRKIRGRKVDVAVGNLRDVQVFVMGIGPEVNSVQARATPRVEFADGRSGPRNSRICLQGEDFANATANGCRRIAD